MRVLLIIAAVLSLAGRASAAEPPRTAGDGPARATMDFELKTTELKRAEAREPKLPTLRFLRDNRVFLRAQLDRLREQTTVVRFRHAVDLDARMLRLRELAAEVAAARDTVRGEQLAADGRTLLASVTELGDLEAQLDRLDDQLAAQRRRLSWLERDYLANQRTALVVLLRGAADVGAPARVTIREQDDTYRIELDADQQRALAQGGLVQVLHEYVEPRDHHFDVSLGDGDPATVVVTAEADRLTFLTIDLAGVADGAAAPAAEVWQR